MVNRGDGRDEDGCDGGLVVAGAVLVDVALGAAVVVAVEVALAGEVAGVPPPPDGAQPKADKQIKEIAATQRTLSDLLTTSPPHNLALSRLLFSQTSLREISRRAQLL